MGPSYNLCKRIENCGPNYNLPKLKYKTLIYLSKNSKLGARLRNGKVLGTHSAQTESSLLNSNDQYTFFCMILNDMLNIHDRRLTKINLNKFALWMCPLFQENSDIFLWIKNWICKENQICFVNKKKLDLLRRSYLFCE